MCLGRALVASWVKETVNLEDWDSTRITKRKSTEGLCPMLNFLEDLYALETEFP